MRRPYVVKDIAKTVAQLKEDAAYLRTRKRLGPSKYLKMSNSERAHVKQDLLELETFKV